MSLPTDMAEPTSPSGEPDSSVPPDSNRHPESHHQQFGSARRPHKRRAPSPHPLWGRLFPFVVLGAAALVFAVWSQGTRLVLDSNAGARIETITDPTAPGYRAFVDPTPTMLVAHVSDASELVGITVLARTALAEGGTAVLVSAELLLDPTGNPDDAILVGELYASEGLAGLSRAIADLFGFGFRETLEINTSGLAAWLRLVEPLTIVLNDDLVSVDATGTTDISYRAGIRELSGADAARIYGWLNDGEVGSNRVQRQADLWEVWLSQVGRAADLQAATLPFTDGLSVYLRSLGNGTRRLEVLPLDAVSFGGDGPPFYAQTAEQKQQLKSLAREMVPLPIAPHVGARPRVSLLDGTGSGVGDQMLPLLVDAGAEVTVIGNADIFGLANTTVAYHVVDQQQAATALAAAIGAELAFVDDPNQPVDITVTVGSDWIGS